MEQPTTTRIDPESDVTVVVTKTDIGSPSEPQVVENTYEWVELLPSGLVKCCNPEYERVDATKSSYSVDFFRHDQINGMFAVEQPR